MFLGGAHFANNERFGQSAPFRSSGERLPLELQGPYPFRPSICSILTRETRTTSHREKFSQPTFESNLSGCATLGLEPPFEVLNANFVLNFVVTVSSAKLALHLHGQISCRRICSECAIMEWSIGCDRREVEVNGEPDSSDFLFCDNI